MNMADMYVHMDENFMWRWYFYAPSGICFISRQAYRTCEDALDAMKSYHDVM